MCKSDTLHVDKVPREREGDIQGGSTYSVTSDMRELQTSSLLVLMDLLADGLSLVQAYLRVWGVTSRSTVCDQRCNSYSGTHSISYERKMLSMGIFLQVLCMTVTLQ